MWDKFEAEAVWGGIFKDLPVPEENFKINKHFDHNFYSFLIYSIHVVSSLSAIPGFLDGVSFSTVVPSTVPGTSAKRLKE